MRTNIRWTTEELEFLATIVAEQRLKNFQPSLMELMNRAMEQLPKERRRKLTSGWSNQQRLYQMIVKKIQERLNEHETINREKKIDLSTISTEALIATVLTRLQSPSPSIVTKNNDNIEVLDKLDKLEEKISRLGIRSTIVREETASNIVYIPRVVIIGLLPRQQREVGEAVGTKIDLRFIETDRKDKTLPKADYIVLMIKFINHNWDVAAQQVFSSDKIIRHNGGISELINLLHSLC